MAWKLENNSEQKQSLPGMNFRFRGLAVPGIIYLVAFAIAEYITYYVNDVGGIICYFTILLILIINSTIDKNKERCKLWLALGLVPLIRIANLVIPLAEISEIFWYIFIAIPVLAGIFVIARTVKFSIDDIGLNVNKPVFQILAAASGIVLAIIDYYILKPEALNNQLTFQSTIFPALILIIATGFTEEMAFRGVMQRAADVVHSGGWVYIAIVYTIMQIGQGSVLHGVFTLGTGLFYGWIVKKTGSILGVACSHGLLNVGLYLILPHLF